MSAWHSTFSLREGAVHYHQTGARIPIDGALVRDIATWLTYYVPLRVRAAFARLRGNGPRLHFVPHDPPPWYLIWNAVAWIGARPVHRAEDADATIYFEDSTWGEGLSSAGDTMCINGACTDVSKSHVAAVFERVFGYPLSVDPATWEGRCVEKGETNGAHDGRIVLAPLDRKENKVYQRLIETGDDNCVEDLRTPCVGGVPVVVFVKRRPRTTRFANFNSSVALRDPANVFSADEMQKIRRFTDAMRLDWGGLDILRDWHSGKLYVVDVNKTDMPPLALPFAGKMRASMLLGCALQRLITGRSDAPQLDPSPRA